MPELTTNSSMMEVATAVTEALMAHNISAVLSGGGAVSLYSDARYQTVDLDFVTAAMRDRLIPAMAAIGFSPEMDVNHKAFVGRHFTHPEVEWVIEFPPAPIAFGETEIRMEEIKVLETKVGLLRIITPTQCVMDRLTSHFHGKDPQAVKQARMVLEAQAAHINWAELEAWVGKEGLKLEELDQFRV